MPIKTNAVDSFVINNLNVGNGEAKLYLRQNSSINHRNFFSIDGNLYGYTTTRYNGYLRLRENGPTNNCFFLKDELKIYIQNMLGILNPNSSDYTRLSNFLHNIDLELKYDCNPFTVNYVYDNQDREYIGSEDSCFDILRYLAISRGTIIRMEKLPNNTVKFSLEPGQL